VAAALGIRSQAVSQWKKVPPRRALEIEKITQGKLRVLDSKPIHIHQPECRTAPSQETAA